MDKFNEASVGRRIIKAYVREGYVSDRFES